MLSRESKRAQIREKGLVDSFAFHSFLTRHVVSSLAFVEGCNSMRVSFNSFSILSARSVAARTSIAVRAALARAAASCRAVLYRPKAAPTIVISARYEKLFNRW